jgi:hypothetical protein
MREKSPEGKKQSGGARDQCATGFTATKQNKGLLTIRAIRILKETG